MKLTNDLKLVPTQSWAKMIPRRWNISGSGAIETKNVFFNSKIFKYKNGRNFPSMNSVSGLSPYINWGQVSVNELWYQCQDLLETNKQNEDILHFLSELGWREFSYNLLYHFPQINIINSKTNLFH